MRATATGPTQVEVLGEAGSERFRESSSFRHGGTGRRYEDDSRSRAARRNHPSTIRRRRVSGRPVARSLRRLRCRTGDGPDADLYDRLVRVRRLRHKLAGGSGGRGQPAHRVVLRSEAAAARRLRHGLVHRGPVRSRLLDHAREPDDHRDTEAVRGLPHRSRAVALRSHDPTRQLQQGLGDVRLGRWDQRRAGTSTGAHCLCRRHRGWLWWRSGARLGSTTLFS